MKLSVITLGDLVDTDPRSQAQRYADILTLGVWAEELGFDGFHIGEHHFCDYIVSNPVPLLTAVAMKTQRIRLSTAVTLLANRDPVLVAEDYAALDLLSGGRAELVVGRGNFFTECYRQFGQDMGASREAFEENLDLLVALWGEAPVSSSGATRPPLDRARVQPKPLQRPHPMIWIGGGSSPDSAQSAARRGLGFQMPGVFTGAPFFRPLADLYRAEFRAGALGAGARGVGFTAHCFVGEDTARARAFWAPVHTGYLDWVSRIAAPPGVARVGPEPDFARATGDMKTRTALCGSPRDVIAMIEEWRETLGGLDALLLKFDGGGLPMDDVRRSMGMFAREVAPVLRDFR
jgi:alkanesulfonate monooxygenase SsuD/methylene tetrahydromethanopterin reductase-like flavin-dependent oxidoreductase (luciferase family)